jgi:hypothetical protein
VLAYRQTQSITDSRWTHGTRLLLFLEAGSLSGSASMLLHSIPVHEGLACFSVQCQPTPRCKCYKVRMCRGRNTYQDRPAFRYGRLHGQKHSMPMLLRQNTYLGPWRIIAVPGIVEPRDGADHGKRGSLTTAEASCPARRGNHSCDRECEGRAGHREQPRQQCPKYSSARTAKCAVPCSNKLTKLMYSTIGKTYPSWSPPSCPP